MSRFTTKRTTWLRKTGGCTGGTGSVHSRLIPEARSSILCPSIWTSSSPRCDLSLRLPCEHSYLFPSDPAIPKLPRIIYRCTCFMALGSVSRISIQVYLHIYIKYPIWRFRRDCSFYVCMKHSFRWFGWQCSSPSWNAVNVALALLLLLGRFLRCHNWVMLTPEGKAPDFEARTKSDPFPCPLLKLAWPIIEPNDWAEPDVLCPLVSWIRSLQFRTEVMRIDSFGTSGSSRSSLSKW